MASEEEPCRNRDYGYSCMIPSFEIAIAPARQSARPVLRNVRKMAPTPLKSPARVTDLSRRSAGRAGLAVAPRRATHSIGQGGSVLPPNPLISPRRAGEWRPLRARASRRPSSVGFADIFSRKAGEGTALRTPAPSAPRRSPPASPGLRSSPASPRGRGRRSSSSCRAGSCRSGSWAGAGRPAPA